MAKTFDLSKANRNEIMILPNPLKAGAYFRIKYPEGEVIKRVELLDTLGERINETEITFSKMGLYLPEVAKGGYLLRLSMDQDTLFKRVNVE